MKILFLTHYFPPEVNAPASRTYEHCRAWVEAGHEVTVVTCAPNHPRGRVYEGYRNRPWQREKIDGIDVIRLWTYLSANEGFVRRTLNYVSYMLACILAAPWMPQADVVVSTSPQFFNGLAGYFVSWLRRRPWVLEIRDLWPDSILAVGAIRNAQVIGILRRLERFACRHADQVVAVTDGFVPHLRAVGAEDARISVIKNGVDLARFDSDSDATGIRQRLGIGDRVVVAYIGTHGMAHGLDTVLEAADRMRGDERVVFLLVGDGADRARLMRARASRGLDNVIMLGQQPKRAMPELWACADISLVLLRRASVFETVLPSKIVEAMAMRVPIVLGVDGEARRLVESAGAGVAIEPENADQLVDAVRRLAEDESLRKRCGNDGRAYVVKHFDRRILAARYLEMLRTVCARVRE